MSSLPDGWYHSTLGAISHPNNGLQTGPFGSQLKAAEYVKEGVPVVMPQDMVRGRIDTADIVHIPQSKANDLERHKLQEGDIVFARRGDIGRCALITEKEQSWICGTGSLRARLSEHIEPEYVFGSVRYFV